MKLVEGGSLAERLKQAGGLSWPEVVRLVEQIAEALDFAHAQGVLSTRPQAGQRAAGPAYGEERC